jgi:hypothetical protein
MNEDAHSPAIKLTAGYYARRCHAVKQITNRCTTWGLGEGLENPYSHRNSTVTPP